MMSLTDRVVLRASAKFREILIRQYGYRPKLFWEAWAWDFDRGEEKRKLHPWNLRVLDWIQETRPGRVLEIGCGFGRNLRELFHRGFSAEALFGVDLSKRMLKKCRRYLGEKTPRLQQADVRELPFREGSFDTVYVSLVLMHVPPGEVEKAIQEAVRISRRQVVFLEEYPEDPCRMMTRQLNDYTFAHDYPSYLGRMGLKISRWETMGGWCVFCVDRGVS